MRRSQKESGVSLDLLTVKEAAALLRLRPKTLQNWYTDGRGPRSCKVGRHRLYRRQHLEDYIESREVDA